MQNLTQLVNLGSMAAIKIGLIERVGSVLSEMDKQISLRYSASYHSMALMVGQSSSGNAALSHPSKGQQKAHHS